MGVSGAKREQFCHFNSENILINCAIKNNFTEIAVLLMENTDIKRRDHKGRTIIQKAIRYGHVGLVKHLIEEEIDVRIDHIPVNFEIPSNRFEIAKLLIDQRNINNQGIHTSALLHRAVKYGNIDFVRYLIENGARLGK